MNKLPRTLLWALAPLGLLSIGCSGTGSTPPDTHEYRAALNHATSCADLETMLKQDATAKMNEHIDATIAMLENMDSNWGYFGGVDYAEDGNSTGSSGTGGPTSGGDPNQGGGGAGGAPAHSETNTQVEGVDEADIVKTDGNNIYLLHGNSFQVLSSWPVSSLGIASSVAVEGHPIEMFVAGDQVVVYSQVDGADVYTKAGIQPRNPYYDGIGYYDGPMYDGYYNPYFAPLTKITVLSLTGGAPSVQKELYFEGNYASSRRVDAHVRTVLSGGAHGPDIAYWPENAGDVPTPQDLIPYFQQLRVQNLAKIWGSTIDDWMPHRFVKSGDTVQKLPVSCDDYYVPDPGSTAFGLTTVSSIDLGALTDPPAETGIFGAVDTVYANADSMYLAGRGWVDNAFMYDLPDTPIEYSKTYFHKFDLTTNPTHPSYVASGVVPGHVHNQFSIDEKDDFLRVTTTSNRVSKHSWETSNNLFVLATQGADLVPVGFIKGLAKDEQIYSTRFVGNRGYVVTFRQVDPLFVIDLANPVQPKVLSELKIPGFSEYMHPIDEGHLLTIGQDANDQGQVQGLALQIFDVTDAKNPALAHKYVFSGQDYGYSEAQYNHKAFTYYAPLKALAFPFSAWDQNGMKSTLELFNIDVTTGIQKLGSIDHSGFFGNVTTDPYEYYCGGYDAVTVRRGLFIDNYVYSISYGGVIASPISDPTTPAATLALPEPNASYNDCAYYY